MNKNCPHCGASLERTKPLSVPKAGQRKVLPLLMAMACPECKGRIRLNAQPWERRLRIADVLVMMILVGLAIEFEPRWFIPAMLAFGGIVELALVALGRTAWKDWPRYEKDSPVPEGQAA